MQKTRDPVAHLVQLPLVFDGDHDLLDAEVWLGVDVGLHLGRYQSVRHSTYIPMCGTYNACRA